MSFEFDALLSHSSKDKAIVRPIAERLRADGIKVWFDEWCIRVGDSIPAKIEKGLDKSRLLVLFMSQNAFGSDWSQLEAGTFRFRDPLNKELRFIPIRLDDAAMPGSLGQFRYIDCRKDAETAYRQLLEACRPQSEWPFPPIGSDQEEIEHLKTIVQARRNEWKRIRADFEAEARKYHDAQFSLLYIEAGIPSDERYPQPNHIINLWQFLGENDSEGNARLRSSELTNFGIRGALLSTFALITGKEFQLFCRMANRAGSLIPAKANNVLNDAITERFAKLVNARFPIFATNSNPLAKWLNHVIVANSIVHPERFRAGTFSADAFAASLTAFDYFKIGQ